MKLTVPNVAAQTPAGTVNAASCTVNKVLALYQRVSRLPLVGRPLFSLGFALKAPYFLTITPSVLELRENYAEVKIRNWWGVHNHIGTVHAIAVANALEMAMGALAEATIPAHLRWIPKGMELRYLALSDSSLVAIAETDPGDWVEPGEVRVRVRALRSDNITTVEGAIVLHTSLRADP
ncbi:MAG TPA: hotdog fold domain-containing protein [Jatrophihabitantaceae bacterium]|nr:hotdog fold domain-containing protein [Jatrophihabitantaceae bacterium]